MCTEEQIEKVMNMEEMKCPCCGKRTVSEYDICDVCVIGKMILCSWRTQS